MVLAAVRILTTIAFLYSKSGRQRVMGVPFQSTPQYFEGETSEIRLGPTEEKNQRINMVTKESDLSKKRSTKSKNRANMPYNEKRTEPWEDKDDNLEVIEEGANLVKPNEKTVEIANTEKFQKIASLKLARSDAEKKRLREEQTPCSEAIKKENLLHEFNNVVKRSYTKWKINMWKAHGSVYDAGYKLYQKIAGWSRYREKSRSPDSDVHVDANPALVPENSLNPQQR
uniref:AlNc14C10G1227 protein n=1 Tax=Albugo laibachii Nc14 TaxID=890382 RepID=F0W2I0_9STRA|nr:AlNc14C10G1227 [Albugo laibachii Nc14]|eukprot:CCA15266.1 AlNc14C10G1227 [Albugo laibachii Nc14]